MIQHDQIRQMAMLLFSMQQRQSTHFVSFMNHPVYDFSASILLIFFTPFNVKIGDTSTPIPVGSKGNFGCYEANDICNNIADSMDLMDTTRLELRNFIQVQHHGRVYPWCLFAIRMQGDLPVLVS